MNNVGGAHPRTQGFLQVADADWQWALEVNLVGAGNGVTSCDLRVFVDQAAESVPALDALHSHAGERRDAADRRGLLQRAVGLWGANT